MFGNTVDYADSSGSGNVTLKNGDESAHAGLPQEV